VSLIDPDHLRVEVADGVSTARLSRPAAGNALDRQLADSLVRWAADLEEGANTGEIRVAVLRHDGPMYCVGGDLKHFLAADDTSAELKYVADTVHMAIKTLNASRVPLVTVVDGVAAGGGIGVALMGDIVIVSDKARFKMAYTDVGLSPDCGTSWLLTRRIGLARATEFALTNRVMSAAEAGTLGLVSLVVESGNLEERVAETVASLAKGPRHAIAHTKRLLRKAEHSHPDDVLDDEAASIVAQSVSAEGVEGVRAFVEKRPSVFT
jgi:2-(1,2-epoxy-1,2-dihydrophenyl)acetyl-CoA isomerase